MISYSPAYSVSNGRGSGMRCLRSSWKRSPSIYQKRSYAGKGEHGKEESRTEAGTANSARPTTAAVANGKTETDYQLGRVREPLPVAMYGRRDRRMVWRERRDDRAPGKRGKGDDICRVFWHL